MTIQPDSAIIRNGTWLAAATNGQSPRRAKPGTALVTASLVSGDQVARVMFPTKSGQTAPIVLIDGGNGALKIIVPLYQSEQVSPMLYARRIETCHGRPIQTRDAASRQLQYQIDHALAIRIGDPDRAQIQIPPGTTAARYADGMYRQIICAAVVETLREAGWTPETASTIYLGYALPSNDYTSTGEIRADAADAVRTLSGMISVRRTNKADEQDWAIRVAGIYVGEQSYGVYYGLSRTYAHQIAISGFSSLRTLDIGYGHTHGQIVDIGEDGSDTTRSWEIESGMRIAAEQLVTLVSERYQDKIDQAQAQIALRTGTYTLGVGDIDCSDLVVDAIAYAAPRIISAAEASGMADPRGALLISGGGAAHPAMRQHLAKWLDNSARAKRPNFIVSDMIVGFANAIGMYGYISNRIAKARPWR